MTLFPKIRVALLVALAAFALLPVLGCRGGRSDDAPIVPLRNMHNQPRYSAQQASAFFKDGRSMRPLVEGTVAREMEVDPLLQTGKQGDNNYVPVVPEAIVQRHGSMNDMLNRGRERYDIYCAPCHGLTGDGDGTIAQRAESLGAATLSPPTFHDDRLRHVPDGQLFATVSNGIRNMPPYAHVVQVDDRWAIVGYLRALQLSQASPQDRARPLEEEPLEEDTEPQIILTEDEQACQGSFLELLSANRVEFATGSATIRPASQPLLAQLAQTASGCEGALIEISGHTDNVGEPAGNQVLSNQRASAVRDRLVRLRVDPERLRAVGYGETRPRMDNDSEEGRAQNRRIEFNIVRSFPTDPSLEGAAP